MILQENPIVVGDHLIFQDKIPRFGKGNAKLYRNVATFTLPAGVTCPGALECKACADCTTGKIKDGAKQVFRCYAAGCEARFTSLRRRIWHNYSCLFDSEGNIKSTDEMSDLLCDAISNDDIVADCNAIRIHIGGDFFCQSYFDAWLEVARQHPELLFYAYTKSLPFWINRLDVIPDNMILTASIGGKWDSLINVYELKKCKVFRTEALAVKAGYPVEPKFEPDSFAMHAEPHQFGLVLHGGGITRK
ncbi:MAG: hypothetical protein RR382_02425 [Tannerellaceae bacterium]